MTRVLIFPTYFFERAKTPSTRTTIINAVTTDATATQASLETIIIVNTLSQKASCHTKNAKFEKFQTLALVMAYALIEF